MVVGIDENATSESGYEAEEFIVAEFGRVNLDWFDLARKYRGAIFRLSQDAARQLAEIVAFSANFELQGIRTACVDLFKTEGYCLFEIERNTKPTDLAVHYSRERWNLLDASGKVGDALRPWIKTEYRARYIPEKTMVLVAEQLKIQPDVISNFVVRINLKEKTFGLICEERFVEQMPTGAFSRFNLPTEAMLAVATKYGKAGESASGSPEESEDLQERTKMGAAEEPSSGRESAASESAVEEDGEKSTVVSAAERADNAREDAREDSAADSEVDASKDLAAAERVAPRPSPSPSSKETDEPLPGSTKALEKFIQRKEDRPPVEKNEVRREPVESITPKYATYSRSEVDQMLKQQAETVANSLGNKISSQQRVFQEAVEKQEKTFARLSDAFVTQFDQTRVRLENSSKESAESIHNELEAFKRELSKELEQYRAQINKTVVPVAKFIEDKNAKPPEKAQKEVSQAKGQQVQAAATDKQFLRMMLFFNIAAVVIIPFAIWLVVIAPLVQKMENQLDELNRSRQTSQGVPAPKSTSELPKYTGAGAGTGAGNLNGSNETAHPVTTSGTSR